MSKNGLLQALATTSDSGTPSYRFYTFWLPEILTIEIFYAGDIDLRQFGSAISFQEIVANGEGQARPAGKYEEATSKTS